MRICSACATLMLIATSVLAADTHHVQMAFSHQISAGTQPASAVLEGKANRIVVYSASWCLPCQQLKPVIGSLKKEGYKVVYRDIDKDIDRLKYAYTAVPTIFYLCGDAVVKKETGYRSKEQIKKMLILNADRAPVTPVLGWN